MAGAYVAKPADAAASRCWPDWPLGWPAPGETGYDPDPFFPAPYPPGYAPVLTMVMTATDTITFDGTATVTGSARDNGTCVTNEPSAMTWTAAISGSSVNLRFNGDPSYSSSLSSSVSFGTYWGATPSIEFELTDSNVGNTVTLTGSYVLDGARIENTEDIEISIQIVATAHYELLGPIGAGYYLGQARMRIQGTSLATWKGGDAWYWPDQAGWYSPEERPTGEVSVVSDAGSEAGGTVTVTVLFLRAGEIYDFRANLSFEDCSAQVTVTITIGDDVYQGSVSGDGSQVQVSFEINSDTLVVTQTSP